ncbi:dynein light chain Tctex-type 5 [Megachile rotundata]|uniref:dynein light chain Tctex-type 5 n=1 Tax=Megachile rotundata TaxID=143995 RepID=UPI003FD1565C
MPFQSDSENCLTNPEHEHEVSRYQNTYRLEAHNPFKVDPVDKIVQMLMTTKLEDVSYDAVECPKVCESIATDIKEKIKKLNFDRFLFRSISFTFYSQLFDVQNLFLGTSFVFRYKIIVNVAIIEKAGQSIRTSMGFLWDAEKDNYSTFTYEARTFHAYCCVLGLYYE